MSEKSFIILRRPGGRIIRADYEGGVYIELTFGRTDYKPTEVINVFDYEAGKPEGILAQWRDEPTDITTAALSAYVGQWIVDTEAEWPDWYAEYLANA